MLKSRVSEKKVFPFGDNENLSYYDPHCIKGIYECRDFCGKKCKKGCKIPHEENCFGGTLPANFLFCPTRSDTDNVNYLEFISYGLVEDKNIKEGKKPYKKMENFREDMTVYDFV